MQRRGAEELIDFDPEIERTLRRIRRERKEKMAVNEGDEVMDIAPVQEHNNDRPLYEYARPLVTGLHSSIRRPTVQANNFEIKPAIIQMIQTSVQFSGLPSDDPNAHLANFLEICDTFRHNGVSDDAVRLRLFPFSLRDKAKIWLNSLPPGSIETWQDMAEKFLAKYFPPSKTAKLRSEIYNFAQLETESLYEAWDRFKELLRQCPHHGIEIWEQVYLFYSGIYPTTRAMLDTAAGGTFMKKRSHEAYELLEEMASNNYNWQSDRKMGRKPAGMFQVDAFSTLASQMEVLTRKIDKLQTPSAQSQAFLCECCGGGHPNGECNTGNSNTQQFEDANFVANGFRNNSYSNTYNPGWRQHPNFSWSNNQQGQRPPMRYQQGQGHLSPLGFQRPPPPSEKKDPNLEEVMKNWMSMAETRLQNYEASMHNLETQIGQLANLVADRAQGSLPSNTERNPREHVKAVTLRSGKTFQDVEMKEKEQVDEEEPMKAKEHDKQPDPPSQQKPEVVPYKPRIPYPRRLQQEKMEKQYGKFLEIFKKLHINIPFAEALAQMPKYAKFLKELLSNKEKLEDVATVALNEECSAILLNKLPPKLKDPGSFSIPCLIGSCNFMALCDLGASINLMPFSLFQKLGLGEPKPTNMSLQLADRSIAYPRGIIEDVLVKVDRFVFPVDFVVLDMEEDRTIPLILGRPFLNTGKALIDVYSGKLILRIDDEHVSFDVLKAVKHSSDHALCSRIDLIDICVHESCEDILFDDPVESCLMMDGSNESFSVDTHEGKKWLDANMVYTNPRIRSYEPIERTTISQLLPSIEKPPKLELKPLPSHLRYAFLAPPSNLPVIISSTLTGPNEEKLIRVLREHKGAFGWTIADIKGISPSVCMHKILMEDEHKPRVQPQRRLNPNMKDVVKAEVIKLLDAGIIYPISDSVWVSPVQVVPKKGGITVVENEKQELIPTRQVTGWRVCIDYRKLNEATRKDHFPLPFIDQMLDRLAGHEYYCFLDGYFGYNQIPVDPEDQEKTTFTCPYGTFAYRRMPFGLCNAPATFQRCMMAIFYDMVEDFLEIFMDDFSVFGSSFDACLNNLEKVLTRCEETNLVLNWEKCHFMVQEGIVLGHKISQSGIEVDKAKVEVIANLPPPTTVRGIRSFLGHAGFYRRFIKDFSKIAKPLTNLLVRDVPFVFSSECKQAFETLKEKLISAPIMVAPEWGEPFEMMCDASDRAVGAVLGQQRQNRFQPICYASKTLNETQLNYTTTEKELLAVVFAFDKFRSYLILSKVVVYTDHSALKYLFSKQDARPRLIRWILLLQEFDVEIRDKKGAENFVADHLSRLEFVSNKEGSKDEIQEDFPDEYLFKVTPLPDPWYADFANYLAGNILPMHFSAQDKKKFFSDIKHYLWEDPYLYKVCADQVIRRCVPKEEVSSILYHCHSREAGGHFGATRTAAKVLQSGFY